MRVTETAHWLEWQDWADPILKEPFPVVAGQLEIPDRAGIGIEWDEDAVKAVCRLAVDFARGDGTARRDRPQPALRLRVFAFSAPGGLCELRMASRQTARISSARGESSGQARDMTSAPTACDSRSRILARA